MRHAHQTHSGALRNDARAIIMHALGCSPPPRASPSRPPSLPSLRSTLSRGPLDLARVSAQRVVIVVDAVYSLSCTGFRRTISRGSLVSRRSTHCGCDAAAGIVGVISVVLEHAPGLPRVAPRR